MGVGFVGAVMAAIVADTVGRKGKVNKVCDRDATGQCTELLEDTHAQPRGFAGESRGPRG